MNDRDPSEYDVVRFDLDSAGWSIGFGIYALLVGVVIDDLPFILPWWARRYIAWLFYTALGAAAAGLFLGIRARRKPESRGSALFGIVLNAVVLVLEVLFVLVFRYIWNR